ncbi:unnamed protein product [Didymodactylos carnosus]|uniref:Protein kinase domain-containing protein n=1 Tax=Didymodactylos carnosus TaxID=1234261 RepID=A0A814FPF4_9BILA|nr:unnamed protein product [Didymodactylos carnosus]CAF3755374.1 unnamed protein product [Didymodactylos carnosus]
MYSMGVLMWEAYSKGSMPWSKVEKDDDVRTKVTNGEILQQPTQCSDEYWLLMVKIMSKLPKNRPRFADIKRDLIETQFKATLAKQAPPSPKPIGQEHLSACGQPEKDSKLPSTSCAQPGQKIVHLFTSKQSQPGIPQPGATAKKSCIIG